MARTSRFIAVSLALLVIVSCATIPTGLVVAPADDTLARRVARLVERAGCRMGIVALHVESGRRLEWNSTQSFEGASAIKIAILVEAAARIHDGTLDPVERWRLTPKAVAAGSGMLDEFDAGLTPTNRDLMRLMIAISDNTAANSFIDRFGAEGINARMAALGLSGIRLLGRIPDRDPKETESERWHGLVLSSMTPRDTAELYRRVATETLLDPASDRLILEMLKTQHNLDRLPRKLLGPKDVTWGGKTGSMKGVRTDGGILTTPKGRFVLVAFADGIPDTQEGSARARDTMADIAEGIVATWSRALPDVASTQQPLPRYLVPAVPRIEMTPLEESDATPLHERVFRETDRVFWELYERAGGDLRGSCLVPTPNSWWEGYEGVKIQPITSIVLHHTSLDTDEETIALFQKPESLVSSHFLVGRDGRLYQFVSLEHRAWHAGVSFLHGRQALNRSSVGIEITGDGDRYPFTKEQIVTVTRLVGVLVALFDVKAPFIVGHQHIAPDRKPDPGELFPWNDVMRQSLEIARELSHGPGSIPARTPHQKD